MAGVIDQSGGNSSASITPGVLTDDTGVPRNRRQPYQWSCSNPECDSFGVPVIGYVEDGCKTCGAGADATQGEPLPAVEFNCRACKGTGNVERKCGKCNGSGQVGLPSEGEPPPACDECGGAGTVAFNCGRCQGSGIDPEPTVKALVEMAGALQKSPTVSVDTETGMPEVDLSKVTAGRGTLEITQHLPQVGRLTSREPNLLPSIDEPPQAPLTPPDRVVRYRLLRYEGPSAEVMETLRLSLDGKFDSGTVAITAIAVAEPKSPGVQQAFDLAEHKRMAWPARKPFAEIDKK